MVFIRPRQKIVVSLGCRRVGSYLHMKNNLKINGLLLVYMEIKSYISSIIREGRDTTFFT